MCSDAFGLTNAPSTFQRLMENVLQGMLLNECCVYLDDIVVFSQSFEQHMDSLDKVFSRLHESGLRVKPSKYCFVKESVKYIGHVVSSQCVSTDPDKTEALRNWPRPKNIKDIRRYPGFTSYYQNLSRVMLQLLDRRQIIEG